MTKCTRIEYALISVSDKKGLIECAESLSSLGVAIIATGNTYRLLHNHNIAATELSDYTDFPEIMDGRVKSLHPKIHGGILARRHIDQDVLAQHHIRPIDLVICNVYPFEKTIQQTACTEEQAIENIDIGGPTLIRAAAKNHQDVAVIVDPNDYTDLIDALKKGGTTATVRKQWATKAFQMIAEYDQAISHYFNHTIMPSPSPCASLPLTLTVTGTQNSALRYGENPQQTAACYQNAASSQTGLLHAKQLQGKTLSYNNLIDSDAAVALLNTLGNATAACVIIKHATPCGVAQGDHILSAYQKALACDPQSAFGGIIGLNQTLDDTLAKTIIKQPFIEVILAPNITPEAQNTLATKPNCRVMRFDASLLTQPTAMQFKSISGGFLAQQSTPDRLTIDDLHNVTDRQATLAERQEALFAWQVVKHIKSNAIVYTKNTQTLGIGSGQTSRVFSAEIAAKRAEQGQHSLQRACMASDAFFPFADSVALAHSLGITCIIQPGGSIRDDKVIACANSHNMVMLFTHTREFLH